MIVFCRVTYYFGAFSLTLPSSLLKLSIRLARAGHIGGWGLYILGGVYIRGLGLLEGDYKRLVLIRWGFIKQGAR